MKLRPLAVITVAGLLGLAACGSDDNASPSAQSTDGTTATAAAFNEADVAFAQGMIPHHELAIDMADIALDPSVGANGEVRDLATRIKDGQGPEIERMISWLAAWDQPMSMGTSGGDGMSSMEGMMSADDMDSLGMMTGAEFDTMWMEMMIRHHEGAIAMAETVKADGSNPAVLELADQVITAQQGEIDEMQALLGG
jgi:uncharacterized protein (DUF305 family)